MDSFREVTSGLARVRFNDGELPRETVAKVTLHRDPRDEFTQRVISGEGSDITTGMAHVGGCKPDETGYGHWTDEEIAKRLSGIFIYVQNPSNKDLIRETQLRLVARGADDRETRAVNTKPRWEAPQHWVGEREEYYIRRVVASLEAWVNNAD